MKTSGWLCGLAGVVALSVGAAEVVHPAFLEKTQQNYNGKTKVAVSRTDAGEVLTVSCTVTSKVETAWTILSERIPVAPGMESYVFEFEIRSDTDWLRIGMSFYEDWATDLLWYGADGKLISKSQPVFRFRKGGFNRFRFGGAIPPGTASVVVRLGDDGPNVAPGEDVVIRKVALGFLPKGEKLPPDLAPDILPPIVKSLFASPTVDLNVVVRYGFSDESAIDWASVKVTCAATKEAIPFVREGDEIVLRPDRPWARGVNRLVVTVRDVAGNESVAYKAFLIGEGPRKPAVTLRDDGMILVGGKPYFPIGIFGVKRHMFNAWDYDRALGDLKDVGFNCAHSYVSTRKPEFHEPLAKHGLKTWAHVFDVAKKDDWFVQTGRFDPTVFAWYIGDDTADNSTPGELYDRDEAARMLDGTRLTCQADGIHSDARDTQIGRYLDYADIFMPEIYPILGDSAAADEKCVARTVRDMKRSWSEIAKFGSGSRPHSVWPILQIFHGLCWHRYPTPEEVYAMTFAALIHGGNGVSWFHYQGKIDKEVGYRYSGCFQTEKDWCMTTNMVTRISSLAPVLAERGVPQPESPAVVSGPAQDPLGQPAVTMLLKRHEGDVYVLAVNASPKAVSARIAVPDAAVSGDVLWENRKVALKEGAFVDSFKGFDVHVYRFADR